MEKAPRTLIGPFTQALPLHGLPLKGPLKDEALEVIQNAGILLRENTIEEVGPFKSLLARAKAEAWPVERVEGDYVVLPGLIDAHTHLCFAGSRFRDFAMRNAGVSYLEIAKSGGGIWDTVTKTRRASREELERGIAKRAARHLSEGVTTCEVKSGYGLNLPDELKMLRAIRQANQALPIDLIPTCLAAHIKPRDFPGNAAEYLQYVADTLLEQIQAEKLAHRVDIFIEDTAFSAAEAQSYLAKAKAMGFGLTVHADQFTTGGSGVAVALEAQSADHLEASTPQEVALLAQSNVVAVALPGASLGLGYGFAPARTLLDAGACLAIASDWNPGSAPMGDLLMQAGVLAAAEKLSTAETLAALTYRAAAALALPDRGTLAKGQLADLIAFPTDHYLEILYHQGKLKPALVWKRGKRVVDLTKEVAF